MKVRLGTFARSGIESIFGSDVAAGAQAALIHYTRRLRSGLHPIDFPRFCREVQLDARKAFEVAVDPEVEASLQREVDRQRASLEQLTTHAVLVYLADLDRTLQAELEVKGEAETAGLP